MMEPVMGLLFYSLYWASLGYFILETSLLWFWEYYIILQILCTIFCLLFLKLQLSDIEQPGSIP